MIIYKLVIIAIVNKRSGYSINYSGFFATVICFVSLCEDMMNLNLSLSSVQVQVEI